MRLREPGRKFEPALAAHHHAGRVLMRGGQQHGLGLGLFQFGDDDPVVVDGDRDHLEAELENALAVDVAGVLGGNPPDAAIPEHLAKSVRA